MLYENREESDREASSGGRIWNSSVMQRKQQVNVMRADGGEMKDHVPQSRRIRLKEKNTGIYVDVAGRVKRTNRTVPGP